MLEYKEKMKVIRPMLNIVMVTPTRSCRKSCLLTTTLPCMKGV